MPVTVEEFIDSRQIADESAERTYLVRGTSDELTAREAARTAAPATIDGQVIKDVSAGWHAAEGSTDAWRVAVSYGKPTVISTGNKARSFRTTGGSQHITMGRSLVWSSGPDFKGAINVSGDQVNGVDIGVPIWSFTETHQFDDSAVTESYQNTLFQLTQTVNLGAFRGMAPGECLFMGASGSWRESEDQWEITFEFAGSPNRTGIDIGGLITVPAKDGWDYLWVRYAEAVDNAQKRLVQKPIGAYVHRVYDRADFSSLGIG